MNKIEVTFRERQLSGGVRVDIFEVKPAQAQEIQSYMKEKKCKFHPNVKFDEKSGFLRVAEEIPGGMSLSYIGKEAKGAPAKKVAESKADIKGSTKAGKSSSATKGASNAPKGAKAQASANPKKGYAHLSDLTGNNPIRGQAIRFGLERLIQG